MAIGKRYRFPISFEDAFPQGLVMVGEVRPGTGDQSGSEEAAGVRQASRSAESSPGEGKSAGGSEARAA